MKSLTSSKPSFEASYEESVNPNDDVVILISVFNPFIPGLPYSISAFLCLYFDLSSNVGLNNTQHFLLWIFQVIIFVFLEL